MNILITTLLALTLSLHATAKEKVPELFTDREFNCVIFAKAVNHFISLGEEQAVKELKKLAKDHSSDFKQDFSSNERIGWICRIIFQSKNTEPLRPASFGGLDLPILTMPLKSWNLYPIAESEGTYFILSEGHSLAGRAEKPSAYIDYCNKTGSFRQTKLKIPTKEEATKAFIAFKTAKRWTTIKWVDEEPGIKYTMSKNRVLRFISKQASSIKHQAKSNA